MIYLFSFRSEVDYAHSLRKTIIPLIIDMDFTPDGWLAQHMRKEKTFDFSRRSMFNGSLDALVEHLKTLDAQREDDKTVKINITEKGKEVCQSFFYLFCHGPARTTRIIIQVVRVFFLFTVV